MAVQPRTRMRFGHTYKPVGSFKSVLLEDLQGGKSATSSFRDITLSCGSSPLQSTEEFSRSSDLGELWPLTPGPRESWPPQHPPEEERGREDAGEQDPVRRQGSRQVDQHAVTWILAEPEQPR